MDTKICIVNIMYLKKGDKPKRASDKVDIYFLAALSSSRSIVVGPSVRPSVVRPSVRPSIRPSVGPSVRRSVRRSVRPSFLFVKK